MEIFCGFRRKHVLILQDFTGEVRDEGGGENGEGTDENEMHTNKENANTEIRLPQFMVTADP